jgi:zeaxanthin glucosyltransferase
MSDLAQVSQLTPSLDFPRSGLIGCFHYCGPLRKPPNAAGETWQGDHSRRAFASLGTLQGHRFPVFERISAACAANGLQLTIAHGGLLSANEVERLSRTAEVHDFVPHDRVLAATEVAIVHGGLNTVLDALARAVPLIIIPLAYEQGAIAARVRRSGAGLVHKAGVFRRPTLEALIREVCAGSSYSTAAKKLRDEIRTCGGADRAADIVETVLRTGRPVLAAETVPGQAAA